jgi:hypothetical protein
MLSQIKFGYVLKFLIDFIDTLSFTVSENFALSRNIKFYDFFLLTFIFEMFYLCMFALYQYHAVKVYVGVLMGVQLHPMAAFPLRKRHRHPLTRELGTSRIQSGRLGEGKNFFPQLEIMPRFLGLPACGPGSVPTRPSRLLTF